MWIIWLGFGPIGPIGLESILWALHTPPLIPSYGQRKTAGKAAASRPDQFDSSYPQIFADQIDKLEIRNSEISSTAASHVVAGKRTANRGSNELATPTNAWVCEEQPTSRWV
ncbi:hypothetical protein QYF36_000669 [Acer negundo]|nr:hypothetical protein QYF36_000669 [Acer negundo]